MRDDFAQMLQADGLSSGIVYATGIMKVREVRRMVEDFRAQETIRKMTERILRENNCWENEKAAMAGDLIGEANYLTDLIIPSTEQGIKHMEAF